MDYQLFKWQILYKLSAGYLDLDAIIFLCNKLIILNIFFIDLNSNLNELYSSY